MTIAKDLGPRPGDARWRAAQKALRAGRTRIAHIDTGLAPHPALGFSGETPPPNIHMDIGVNYHDPSAGHLRPVSTLRVGAGLVAGLTEYPDHGVKTLSVILSDQAELRGVAPGAHVVPYRVANGPVFRYPARTASIGAAIDHALRLDPPCRVASISMGNPGFTGLYEWARQALAGEIGTAASTRAAINRAYEAGMIVVCAAGQVIEGVIYPARYARTIAVGGFDRRGALFIHYPPGGYDDNARVDVWARAVGVNRAAAHLGADGAPVWTFAETESDEGGEASGTSYACPQVAAAAALWLETHADALSGFLAAGEGWKVSESFRRALRLSAQARKAENATPEGKGDILVLDVERLLATPPDAAFAYRKRSPA
ncbi:MAG: hypothetical protein CVT71_00840 [Alphaproteobacteria bacterium HGW-Alphaproteobacteria-10]|nr:MAG: hypothetical protein CVT71_00840 [Alphaproteobacteria bacterium HGW-Alphaproteobacteria-10]